jgi:diguanylate cyclase (GGDEF)-like protein
MLVLQCLGALAMLAVWVLETHEGVITPWDRWMLPISAAVIACSALATVLRPSLEAPLRAVPVATFNLFLVVTLHATLAFTSGEEQRYQVLTDLYWVPLGYGCAFVFLNLRSALVVSGLTAAGIFSPLLLMLRAGTLPSWLTATGPFLEQVAMAHGLFVVLLTAVVRLRRSHDRAQAHVEVMRELALTDMLTGLPNRREMTDRLTSAIALSRRVGQPLTVALIDVDRFKSINDRFGHASGDAVLQRLGEVMGRQLRGGDVLGRWGGEEFLLFAPGTPVSSAAELGDRVRRAVAAHVFPHSEPVTVSIGMTQCWPADELASLLKRADEALYRAKTGGRNRVELALAPAESPAGAKAPRQSHCQTY